MNSNAKPIYIHSSFRSGSTWFWSRFRAEPLIRAYYEPFHEILGTLTHNSINSLASNSWASGHPPLERPYFAEYEELLKCGILAFPGGLLRRAGLKRTPGKSIGVRHYRGRFAYRAYYAQNPDPQMARYVRSLSRHANNLGKTPVFGFCRSLGRVAWFKALGDGLNITTWRDPWSQWSSYRRQTKRYGNDYFETRAFIIACQGQAAPLHRTFFDGLRLPDLPHGPADKDAATLRPAFEACDAGERFRIFMRVFMLDMLIAMQHTDMFVDLDRLSDDTAYREDMTLELRRRSGLPHLTFEDCKMSRYGVEENAEFLTKYAAEIQFLEQFASEPVAKRYCLSLPFLHKKLTTNLKRLL